MGGPCPDISSGTDTGVLNDCHLTDIQIRDILVPSGSEAINIAHYDWHCEVIPETAQNVHLESMSGFIFGSVVESVTLYFHSDGDDLTPFVLGQPDNAATESAIVDFGVDPNWSFETYTSLVLGSYLNTYGARATFADSTTKDFGDPTDFTLFGNVSHQHAS